MQSVIVRSDISRIQSRLFDIITVRICNKGISVTHMYYNHEYIIDYKKGLKYQKLHKVLFIVDSIEGFRELENRIIKGKIDTKVRVDLPRKNPKTTNVPAKVIVKAYFFQEENRNLFYQIISKYFRILDT